MNTRDFLSQHKMDITPDYRGMLSIAKTGYVTLSGEDWEDVISHMRNVVYCFTDAETGEILYIGKTTSRIASRLYNHCTSAYSSNRDLFNAIKDNDNILVELYFTESLKDVSFIESLLIWRHQPKFNTDGVKAYKKGAVKEEKKIVKIGKPHNVSEATWCLMQEVYKDMDAGMSKSAVADKYNQPINRIIRWYKKREQR